LHPAVVKSAIKGKTHVVTTSYLSPEIRKLGDEAKKAGIVVMNEIGLDPGIDHLYAIKAITEVHEKGGKVCYSLIFPFLTLNVKVILRLRSSCPTVAHCRRQRVHPILLGTNSLGRLEDSSW
jgi:hypothetical protein